MILALRTDAPMAQIWLIDGDHRFEHQWEAGRQLAEQLLTEIEKLLKKHRRSWANLSGIIIFEGPGSFTGLRISCTVANALAYAQEIPIVGTRGEDWLKAGLKRLENGENDTQVLPHYGAPAHVTKPKK